VTPVLRPLRRRFAIGANYWSRAGGPRMWSRFDAEVVRSELAQLRRAGLDSLRMFAFAPDFMPSPPLVEPAMLARLREFAALAESAGIDLFPTPLVGHMSGENFDFPGQNGRSLYRDPELLDWQEALVRAVVAALADRPNIGGWILTNEFPLWAGVPASGEAESWARRLVTAVRELDATRPVGTGDGCMAGWPTAQLASSVDYIGPHFYYGDVDPLRQAWNSDFQLRSMQSSAQSFGRPVLLEEFGGSSTQVGEVEHAAFVREVMLAAFGCGAAGAFVWCASDFDRQTLGLEPPYSHHAFELGFGLLRADGSEKPACDETRALRQLVDGLGDAALTRPRARAALLRSDWQQRSFPFSWEDKGGLRRTLLQAYVLSAQAGLDVDVIGEDDALDGYALVLVPSTQKLRVPTWHKLEAAAHAGATIYWSYFSGENEFHQGGWCPNFEALTGLRHRLRYGCFDLPGERMVWKGEVALSLPTGEATSSRPQSLARLPVEPAPGAAVETMAVDGAGRLALTEHRLGKGRVIFGAYPIERYLMERADGSTRDVHRLYRLLADEAGIDEAYATRHSDVQSRVLHDGRDDLVIVQHRGWSGAVDDACEVPREAELLYDRGNPAPDAFGPKGGRVYRVRSVR
jgi:endo-1,4-beta-mannosidase